MIRPVAHCQSIKKAPPTFGRFNPKPVHRGHEPNQRNNFAQRQLRHGFIVNTHGTRRAGFRTGIHLVRGLSAFYSGLDRPTKRLWPSGNVIDTGTTQTATRGQERNGFQYIGLSCPVRSKQRNRTCVKVQLKTLMGPEMQKLQRADPNPSHAPLLNLYICFRLRVRRA